MFLEEYLRESLEKSEKKTREGLMKKFKKESRWKSWEKMLGKLHKWIAAEISEGSLEEIPKEFQWRTQT